MTPLRWSREVPTEAGYYWTRGVAWPTADQHIVRLLPSASGLYVAGTGWDLPDGAEWAGPIPEPEPEPEGRT